MAHRLAEIICIAAVNTSPSVKEVALNTNKATAVGTVVASGGFSLARIVGINATLKRIAPAANTKSCHIRLLTSLVFDYNARTHTGCNKNRTDIS